MKRRTILKWLSGALAALSASLVAVPGVGFVIEMVRRRSASKSLVTRLTRVQDLPVGQPILVPVLGTRQDAWTTYPSETIGRVWLVREGDGSGAEAKVAAFTSVCPHLGCQILLDGAHGRFVCPCHKAAFGKDGLRLPEEHLGHRNHAPRGMDSLTCRLVQDQQTEEWWVEVEFEEFQQGLTRKVVKA